MHRLLGSCVDLLARLVQRHEDLYRPVGLQSTVRYSTSSTMLHADILNQGSRLALHIPKSHEHHLETRLNALGVPKDGWFVCAHARENGWFQKLDAGEMRFAPGYSYERDAHRNVDIEDYFPAFDYITSMGGTVIRMGDPSMKPVAGIDGVIDYPFTQHSSMPMDLFLVSRCRFVLGSQTGFSSFPVTFGTPVLVTNFTSLANTAFFPYSNNIFMFKHIIENESGRRLDLEDMFHPSLCTMNDALDLASMGYQCQSNYPEDILEATKEMLDFIENDSFDRHRSTEQELFHHKRLEALDRLWSPVQKTGNDLYSPLRSSESRISAAFAYRYISSGQSQVIADHQ